MKRKITVLLSSTIAMIIMTISTNAYWGSSVKIAYKSGTNYGCTIGVSALPKIQSTIAIADFEGENI